MNKNVFLPADAVRHPHRSPLDRIPALSRGNRLRRLFHSPWRNVVFFALLLLVPAAAGEAYVRSLPNPAKYKHAYLQAHSREVKTLVLGSSHTYYGICPEALGEDAFSAAQVSQTLRYDDFLLHHYTFPNLRTVILPVSDFTLYEELEGSAEWYLANRYRLYMNCDVHGFLSVYAWEITAFRSFAEKLKSLFRPPRMRWSATGQGLEYAFPGLPKNKEWLESGKERARHNHYADLSAGRRGEAYLQHIGDFCRTHGVKLVLVSTPVHASYRAHRSRRQWADTQRRVRRFLSRYREAVYLDFSADPRFGIDDFYDTDHLNSAGARKLSALLRPQCGPQRE